jgi:hypothetical protein
VPSGLQRTVRAASWMADTAKTAGCQAESGSTAEGEGFEPSRDLDGP